MSINAYPKVQVAMTDEQEQMFCTVTDPAKPQPWPRKDLVAEIRRQLASDLGETWDKLYGTITVS